jgi:folate-binding protein YgfZ
MNPATPQHEYDAINSGVGIRLLDDRLIVRVSGDDRISFMHGMCTADVKNLPPGHLARTLFLTEHAHVIADAFLYALEEALWLEVERSRWPVIREHLERFLVADDVELEESGMLAVLDVEGPLSVRAMAECFRDAAHDLKPWQHVEHEGLRIAQLPRYGGPAFALISECEALRGVADRMKQLHPAICELQAQTFEIIRIENGIAVVGTDTDQRTLALEARLGPAIAFNKGCYVGQETVERATAHGSLKRRLCGLRIPGTEVPGTGAVIKLDGKTVGHLSSVARSPTAGIIGLAILHHSAWGDGTGVSITADGATITGYVCELPFAVASTRASS